MKNKILTLTISTLLALPTVAMAASHSSDITPADMRTTPAPNTLQSKVQGPDGELLATQPGKVEISEANAPAVNASSPNLRLDQPLLMGERVQTGDITPADMRTTPAPNTLRQKIQDQRGELVATQPGEVEFIESRRVIVQ